MTFPEFIEQIEILKSEYNWKIRERKIKRYFDRFCEVPIVFFQGVVSKIIEESDFPPKESDFIKLLGPKLQEIKDARKKNAAKDIPHCTVCNCTGVEVLWRLDPMSRHPYSFAFQCNCGFGRLFYPTMVRVDRRHYKYFKTREEAIREGA